MNVGLVLVSHSEKLAQGLAELAGQMAPDVMILPAGGLEGGGLGTDYDRVVTAMQRADSGAGVVLLYDLGSAQMTAELALESAANPHLVLVVDAPFVEGAVAAAVTAQSGMDRVGVAAAATNAAVLGDLSAPPSESLSMGSTATLGAVNSEDFKDTMDTVNTVDTKNSSDSSIHGGESSEGHPGEHHAELTLLNEVGLHARPAALLTRSVAPFDAEVTVHFGEKKADARSVLAIMSLGARQGDKLQLTARGPQAEEAVQAVTALVEAQFNESS